MRMASGISVSSFVRKTSKDICITYCWECNCLRTLKRRRFLWKVYAICPYCYSIFRVPVDQYKFN